MQQQFSVFKLELAQLLARNNPGDPLINLLNPAPQPLAPQQNPEPIQHAPALSESQGQSHVAPAQQPPHHDVSQRLDSLEKLVAEQRGVPPPHHVADSIPHPLNTNITLEPYPAGFRIPQLETYDGMKDPDDHLHAFYSCMQAQNASNALMCKIFPSTLRAVISGLSHERFRDSLLKHPATTFTEVNDRSLKFITAEEYALSQNSIPSKSHNPDWRDENPSRKRMRTAQNRGPMSTSIPRFGRPNSTPPQQSAGKPPVTWTPFNLPRSQIFMQIKNKMDLRRPGPMKTTVVSRDHTRYWLNSQGLSENMGHNPKESVIHQTGKGEVKHQSQAQKRKFDDAEWKNQPITFTSADFDTVVTPHNDPLVTSVLINNCEVQRVLVDTGSAPDIIAAPVEDVEEVPVDDRDPSRKTQIGTRLNSEEKSELIAFLRANSDVFAWTSADMPRIPNSVSQHKLSTNPLKKPVAQKRRLFGGERLQTIKEEANGKWRMCIDYTNLNQACPNDCYPMPNIDKLVEAASGNERLSLLDAYSSYHQVPMAPEDEEKTSFYAGDEIYCYVMMPFGLKNVGATYQTMVTIVFRAQIGRNLEVYVDDIVVKSLKADDHLTDLEETFNNLRQNRMRLNPAKCIFGVASGKFLGFMVSRRGIEVNPEKIRAIAEIEPPKLVKDIQRLTGRVAALHRFISKSADKCLLFFKIMRSAAQKDESGKQKKFEWTQECQAAFDELKSYLSSPPLLTKAKDGEILYLYLGISDEAISSVLVREEAKQQKPIYYISSVLHGAELRYPIAEKVALAVVTSARRLRPYFQSHPIIILTDQPLRQILQKPKCSGRLIKWAVELGEFEITFQQRSTIRAQALADFIVECTPYGYRSEHALKFNFDATNNMAKYEALLLALVAELKCKFQKFCLSKIPKTENEQADYSPSLPRTVLHIPDQFLWRQEAMKLRKKASRYTLIDGVLYKRSFSLSLLRCLNPYEAEYALREVHEGVCGSHVGARTLAHKVLRQGYYWPNMYKDATHFVQRCLKCQFFAHLTHQPAEELTTLVAPWPFAQWGLDLLGPFVKGVTLVYHPESNGMVESVNKCILEGIKPRLEQHKAKWADDLNNVLWAYRTTSRTATDLVLRKAGLTGFETRFGKLAPNWEGPYTVAEVPHPGAYILRDTEGKRVPRVWNVNNLKKFYP
ncbi:hypothetical protein SLEP1_g39295 [Rubroshorea leprosula]|uniref:Reverse transcriptase n=1 Tax=Rubroshorea leprosula TaxID=152421 RepID=A0AAV5KZS1_9ROSI|nr:hypothetical protein SLEP1_g39295 [Rubroshorea leprosula]